MTKVINGIEVRLVRDEVYISRCGKVWYNKYKTKWGYSSKWSKVDMTRFRPSIRILGVQELVYRALAKAWIPNPNDLPLVCHKDDNPYNNDIDNLYWGTKVDNGLDASRNGKLAHTGDSPRARAVVAKQVIAHKATKARLNKTQEA